MKNHDTKLFLYILLICLLVGGIAFFYLNHHKNSATKLNDKTFNKVSINRSINESDANKNNNRNFVKVNNKHHFNNKHYNKNRNKYNNQSDYNNTDVNNKLISYQNERLVSQELNFNYDQIMNNDSFGQSRNKNFNQYSLVLNWSPNFCKQSHHQNYKYDFQCDIKNKFGWIVHGLWPNNTSVRSISEQPRFCKGDLPKVDANIIKNYLSISPSAKLLQGEWEKHGACAFDKPIDYFEKMSQLYQNLTLPSKYIKSPKELINWLKQNNSEFRYKTIKVKKQEIYFCYNLDWQPTNCN